MTDIKQQKSRGLFERSIVEMVTATSYAAGTLSRPIQASSNLYSTFNQISHAPSGMESS
jgi:hypothetical protein